MASFIPNHLKKKRVLARKEALLCRLIASGAGRDKLLAAAEEVRQARIRVQRVKLAIVPPTNGPMSKCLEGMNRAIDTLEALTAEDVLSEFRSRNYGLAPSRARAIAKSTNSWQRKKPSQ